MKGRRDQTNRIRSSSRAGRRRSRQLGRARARLRAEDGGGEDPILGRVGVAVAEAERLGVHVMHAAGKIDGFGRDQHVLGLDAVGARVHAQRAADRARNAYQSFEPGKSLAHRGGNRMAQLSPAASSDRALADRDLIEDGRRQAQHHAWNSGIAD